MSDEIEVWCGDPCRVKDVRSGCKCAEFAALRREQDEARDEIERLRLAMMGGEDVPGYAASIPLDDLLATYEQSQRDLRIYYEARDAEIERLRAALREIATMDWFARPSEIARAALKETGDE